MLHHLPLGDRFDNIPNAGLFAELIFAVLKFASRLKRDYATHEDIGLIDHALTLQQIGNVANSKPAWDIDHLVFGQRTRCFEALLAYKQAGTDRNGEHHEQRKYCISDQNNRMTSAP
jgi:hypothetical protein